MSEKYNAEVEVTLSVQIPVPENIPEESCVEWAYDYLPEILETRNIDRDNVEEVERIVYCDSCGEPKEHVDEPMVSGFVGYVCTNEECVIDS